MQQMPYMHMQQMPYQCTWSDSQACCINTNMGLAGTWSSSVVPKSCVDGVFSPSPFVSVPDLGISCKASFLARRRIDVLRACPNNYGAYHCPFCGNLERPTHMVCAINLQPMDHISWPHVPAIHVLPDHGRTAVCKESCREDKGSVMYNHNKGAAMYIPPLPTKNFHLGTRCAACLPEGLPLSC